jgi:hypothetical protein
MNPPAETFLRKGDHVVALGNIDTGVVEEYLRKRSDQTKNEVSSLAEKFIPDP